MAGRRGLGRGLDSMIPDKIGNSKNNHHEDNGVDNENSISNSSETRFSESDKDFQTNKNVSRETLEEENKMNSDVSRETSETTSNQRTSDSGDSEETKLSQLDSKDDLLNQNNQEKNKINVSRETLEDEKNADMFVDINLVEPSKDQPRKQFDDNSLLELAESIKNYGILQPIIVNNKGEYYQIVAGERRWRAAKIAGLKKVPIIIKNLTDGEIVEISLIENLQRDDLNPIEEALAFKRLTDEYHLTQEELSKRVSKSRSAITNSIRLLNLNNDVQKMLSEGQLTTGHARALLAIDDNESQILIAEQIIQNNLSVRETENLVKEILKPEKKRKTKEKDHSRDYIYQNLAEQMKQVLGTKVTVKNKDNDKGKIEIEYYSQEDLNRIFEMIQSVKK